jgi:thioredoxin-like negative regulator of GroEL
MANANRAYDHGDYEEARQIASQVLIRQPSNARMLRILVSSSCVEGDAVAAQASMTQLSAADQEQMRARCQRYGINLTVSAGQ